MPDPLRQMKKFLARTLVCGFLATLPFGLVEGMWASPDWREYARKIDGSAVLWVAISIYLLFVILIWCRWITRSDPPEQ